MRKETIFICCDPACQPFGFEKLHFSEEGIITHLTVAHNIAAGSYGTRRLVHWAAGSGWMKRVWLLCIGTSVVHVHVLTHLEPDHASSGSTPADAG
jgi:hypothetical protein